MVFGNQRRDGNIPIMLFSGLLCESPSYLYNGWADSRYTIKSQLPPAIAATIIAIQYAVNYQTFMVFLYM
jgi:hypothetical protein